MLDLFDADIETTLKYKYEGRRSSITQNVRELSKDERSKLMVDVLIMNT
jgi:hypothetical protein